MQTVLSSTRRAMPSMSARTGGLRLFFGPGERVYVPEGRRVVHTPGFGNHHRSWSSPPPVVCRDARWVAGWTNRGGGQFGEAGL